MRSRLLALLLLLLTLLAGAAAAVQPAAAAPGTPLLVAVRAAHHPGVDRLVFEFTGGLPERTTTRYVPQVVGDGSGLPIPLAGRAQLEVSLVGAAAHTDAGRTTVPSRTAWALPNVVATVVTGDFEAVVTYGVGLASRQPVRVSTLRNPFRVVVDVEADIATVQRSVHFLDSRRFAAGTPPYVRAVQRPVLAALPGTTSMDRLYAGPTPAEARTGLRFLNSGSTGTAPLVVQDGVARVRLLGGCRSGGSTVGVADLIVPTLKQFPTIDVVKVLDPQGRTSVPTGRSDSVPECLEP